MNKTLASLVLAGTAAISSGCATVPKVEDFTVKNNISNLGTGRMTQDDAPFKYETLCVAGIPYELENATRRLEDEEDFILRPDMESTLWRNFNKREVRLESDEIMVPRKLLVGEEGFEYFANEVDFEITGPYALRADITRPDNKDLSIEPITHQLERYGIETRTIKSSPYAIAIKMNKTSRKIDNVLLIRAGEDDVELGTNRINGMITLRSPGDIYELVKMKQKDYDARTVYANMSTTDKVLSPEFKIVR